MRAGEYYGPQNETWSASRRAKKRKRNVFVHGKDKDLSRGFSIKEKKKKKRKQKRKQKKNRIGVGRRQASASSARLSRRAEPNRDAIIFWYLTTTARSVPVSNYSIKRQLVPRVTTTFRIIDHSSWRANRFTSDAFSFSDLSFSFRKLYSPALRDYFESIASLLHVNPLNGI